MASIDIKPQNIVEGDIDVNLLEIDSRAVDIEERNQWELTDAAKYGHLNKIGKWNNTTLEIVGEIDSKDVTNATAIVYCKWTNSTSYYNLKLDKNKSSSSKKVFIENLKFERSHYSSRVVVIIKFLKENLLVGVSPEFTLQVDNREAPDLDDGLFNFRDANFNDSKFENSGLIQQYEGQGFFSSIKRPEYDSRLTIYYNVDFPGINKGWVDEGGLKGTNGVIQKLFSNYLASAGFISECVDITFYLSEQFSEKREERQFNQFNTDIFKEELYERVRDDFEGTRLNHSPKKIFEIASVVFPEQDLSDNDRLYKWWSLSESEKIYTLLEFFHMGFQKIFEPDKTYKDSIKDALYGETETEEEIYD